MKKDKLLSNGKWLKVGDAVYQVSEIECIGIDDEDLMIDIYTKEDEFSHRCDSQSDCEQRFNNILEELQRV